MTGTNWRRENKRAKIPRESITSVGTAEGDRVGLLLDLDQGSMTVYKNDERLGVMATSLSGEYSWAVTLCNQGTSACIEAAPPPASPTAEELAQAVAYQAALISEAGLEEESIMMLWRGRKRTKGYISIYKPN
jgi:hypothetical protein